MKSIKQQVFEKFTEKEKTVFGCSVSEQIEKAIYITSQILEKRHEKEIKELHKYHKKQIGYIQRKIGMDVSEL